MDISGETLVFNLSKCWCTTFGKICYLYDGVSVDILGEIPLSLASVTFKTVDNEQLPWNEDLVFFKWFRIVLVL